MKCIVIYFSLTSNTEKVARKIQEGIKQAAGHCDLAKLKDINPRRLFESDYDLIGIGSPVWSGPPRHVINFINDLMGVGGKHAFVFSTHGSIPFHFVPQIVPPLKSKGLIVIGWNDWYGNHFWPWAVWPYATEGHPDEIDLKEAEDFGREIVQRSRRVSAGETNLIPEVPADWLEEGYPVQAFWDPTWYKGAIKYHKEKCLYPKCRICMENCFTYSIDLSLDPPRIADPCYFHCTWCTMICPTGAMEMDEYLKTQLPNFIRLEAEHALPNLSNPLSQGRFRRLLPKDNVGTEGTYADVYKKHPKWIIGKGPGPK